jgi:hypothetical protein
VVRTPTLSTVFYAPGVAPTDPDQFRRYVEDELRKVSAAVALLAAGRLEKTTVAPSKPREGDVRLADGTNWNPGNGAGVYAYYNGAWHSLG